MGYCDRCGTLLAGDASGLCTTCESSSHGTGTPADVPCQRCGMYLPSHELQMWNSRLYCAYCIMDVKDDEKRISDIHKEQIKPAEIKLPEDSGKTRGNCERCGRATDHTYHSQGRQLCSHCYFESGAPQSGDGAPRRVSQLAVNIHEGVRAKSKDSSQPSSSPGDEKSEGDEKKSGFGAFIERIKKRLSKKKKD